MKLEEAIVYWRMDFRKLGMLCRRCPRNLAQ